MNKEPPVMCGMRSNHLAIVIGVISLVQAAAYITTFVVIFVRVAATRFSEYGEDWWSSTNEMFAEFITISGVIIYSARVMFSGILVLGGVLSISGCLVMFYITGLIGVVFTVALGIVGLHLDWTVQISIIILSLSVSDIVCMAIVLKACIHMRALKSSGEILNSPSVQHPQPVTSPTMFTAPPPYFPYYNTIPPGMSSQYTELYPEIRHVYSHPPAELNRQYGMPPSETRNQLPPSSLELPTQFTTPRVELNRCYNNTTTCYNPRFQTDEIYEFRQLSHEVDDLSPDEPPRIYYTPVPCAQSFPDVDTVVYTHIANPQLRPKAID